MLGAIGAGSPKTSCRIPSPCAGRDRLRRALRARGQRHLAALAAAIATAMRRRASAAPACTTLRRRWSTTCSRARVPDPVHALQPNSQGGCRSCRVPRRSRADRPSRLERAVYEGQRRGGGGYLASSRRPHQVGPVGTASPLARGLIPTPRATDDRGGGALKPRAPATPRRWPAPSTTIRRGSCNSRTSWGRSGARRACQGRQGLRGGVSPPTRCRSAFSAPGRAGVASASAKANTGHRLDSRPSFGFFAAADDSSARCRGRIAGETRTPKAAWLVLTLQTREQHIRRDKATHKLHAQALNALAGVIYLPVGARGLVELAELMLRRTHYAREALGWRPSTPAGGARVRRARARSGPLFDALAPRDQHGTLGATTRDEDGLLVAITERRTRPTSTAWRSGAGCARGGGLRGPEQPARPDAQGLHPRASTRRSRSSALTRGAAGLTAPEAGVPEVPVDELLPTSQIESASALPEISERAGASLRHPLVQELPSTRASIARLVHDEAQPQLHERGGAAGHPGSTPPGARACPGGARADVAPAGPLASRGLPHVSLQPAGSHGELAGCCSPRLPETVASSARRS